MKKLEIKNILITFVLLLVVICGVLALHIKSIEVDETEYQFYVTDDSISVYDYDRYIGTVKLEGQLKELIEKDNE
jgi:hypothetical protein